MSSAIAYSRADPFRLPAGILTLVAHGIFFALLYLGVSWQAQPPQGMVVDLWSSLPDVNNAPSQNAQPASVKPAEPQKAEPVKPRAPEPAAAKKAEIELSAKKKQPRPTKEKPERKTNKAAQKQAEAEVQDIIKQQELAEQQAENARASQAAAAGELTNEYISKITAKIRRNIVLPPDVADNALAEFDVTLLPGGEVLDARQTRKSGDAAYDSAVERAIRKASPLPVPSDPDLFNREFRNLHLKFRPKDKE
jgi:colicin import membrane protein